MPLIISEIVVNSAGEMAIELHNNDAAGSVNIQNFSFSHASNGGTTTFSVTSSHSINAGDFFTIGHSNFAGMDLTGFDAQLSIVFLGSLMVRDAGLGVVDIFGRFNPPHNNGTDVSFQTIDLNRAPNQNVSNDNRSDFSQGTAADNTLGAPCFLTDTLIATPEGERVVQDLQAGDLVLTAEGRAVPVLWLGEQLVKKRIGQVPEALQPVCIKAGALGNHSDLWVTADHGMIVDDLVINAGALVNGETITWATTAKPYMVYHIETGAHEVILANGAMAETFIDAIERRAFDNYSEYLDLCDVDRIIPEMSRPRISGARLVPQAVKDRLQNGPPKVKLSA